MLYFHVQVSLTFSTFVQAESVTIFAPTRHPRSQALFRPHAMEAMEHGSCKVCAVSWVVRGFASSRQNLEMARSEKGLTSFHQARD